MTISAGLSAIGIDVSTKVINKWTERDSLPMDKFLLLKEWRESQGKQLALDDYLVRTRS